MAITIRTGFDFSQREPKKLPHELVAEPLLAWRIWKITRRSPGHLTQVDLDEMADAFDRGENPFRRINGYRLAAVGQRSDWGRIMEARCTTRDHAEKAPRVGCSCGIWSLKDPRDAFRTLVEYWCEDEDCTFALGQVQIWGRVIECERGYRSEFATPYKVFVYGDHSLAQGIATIYDCVAKPRNKPKRLFAPKRQEFSFRHVLGHLVDPTKYPLLYRASSNEKPAMNPDFSWMVPKPDGTNEVLTNHTQIFRVPTGASKTPQAALHELLETVERTLEYGHPNAQAEGGMYAVRTCGGYRYYLGRDLKPKDRLVLRPLRGPMYWQHGTRTEWLCEVGLEVWPA